MSKILNLKNKIKRLAVCLLAFSGTLIASLATIQAQDISTKGIRTLADDTKEEVHYASNPSEQVITGGFFHFCALSKNDDLKCWGNNSYSQLGLGHTRAIYLSDDIKSSASIVNVGTDKSVRIVSAGAYHTCAILNSGQLKCWGFNGAKNGRNSPNQDRGTLGVGTTEAYIGDQAGDVAGSKSFVDLGKDPSTGKPYQAKAVALGIHHTCAIIETGQVKCWGHNYWGQLDDRFGRFTNLGDEAGEVANENSVVDLGTDEQGNPHKAIAISANGYHTCAILSDENVRCWGKGQNGQLGNFKWGRELVSYPRWLKNKYKKYPAYKNYFKPQAISFGQDVFGNRLKAKSLTTGYEHSCALLNDERIKCWGDNRFGQLGLGNMDKVGVAWHTYNKSTKKWSYHNEVSPSRSDIYVNLGTNPHTGAPLKARIIESGGWHTCAIVKFNNRIKCWGNNWYGETGTKNIGAKGQYENTMGDSLPYVDLGTDPLTQKPIKAKALALGLFHSCALTSTDQIKCWGADVSQAYSEVFSKRKNKGDFNPRDTGYNEETTGDNTPVISLGFDLEYDENAPLAFNQFAVGLMNPAETEITLKAFDADGDDVFFTITQQPQFGVLSGSMPNLKYAPQEGFKGKDSFKYTVTDGTITSSEKTVEIIISDALAPNDPGFDSLYSMIKISALPAWQIKKDCSGAKIAVLDTGIDYNHPDLSSNILVNSAETPNNGIDDDANGYVDDYYGYNFAERNGDPMDDEGHGTHVAGTIAAIGNNQLGITGICQTAQMIPVRFLNNKGEGTSSDAIDAIDYAVSRGVKVINASWGGGLLSQGMKDAIERAKTAGVIFVAASGHDGRDNDINPHFPSSYDNTNIVSVTATNHNDDIAYIGGKRANIGRKTVDIAAPGTGILSTVLEQDYKSFSGTSMATPLVAGAVALYASKHPTYTVDQILFDLKIWGVDYLPSTFQKMSSHGRLNLFRLMGRPDR
jgi:subtilisin family serine protease/alpha-tubulin suppressor-like RCC1 family protein